MAYLNSTSTLFIMMVVVLALLMTVALHESTKRDGWSSGIRWSILFAGVYLLLPAVLASSGWLDQYTPVPRALLPIVAVTLITFLVAFSSLGDKLATSMGLAVLVGFQVFRVPVELLLHRLSTEGTIPEVMTYSGRNFDILTGLSGAVLGLILLRRPLHKGLLLAWNVIGLMLLLNIVAIAALASPTRFQIFTEGPSNLLPSTFPYVWLPTFLVQLALLGHLLLFRKLNVIPPTKRMNATGSARG